MVPEIPGERPPVARVEADGERLPLRRALRGAFDQRHQVAQVAVGLHVDQSQALVVVAQEGDVHRPRRAPGHGQETRRGDRRPERAGEPAPAQLSEEHARRERQEQHHVHGQPRRLVGDRRIGRELCRPGHGDEEAEAVASQEGHGAAEDPSRERQRLEPGQQAEEVRPRLLVPRALEALLRPGQVGAERVRQAGRVGEEGGIEKDVGHHEDQGEEDPGAPGEALSPALSRSRERGPAGRPPGGDGSQRQRGEREDRRLLDGQHQAQGETGEEQVPVAPLLQPADRRGDQRQRESDQVGLVDQVAAVVDERRGDREQPGRGRDPLASEPAAQGQEQGEHRGRGERHGQPQGDLPHPEQQDERRAEEVEEGAVELLGIVLPAVAVQQPVEEPAVHPLVVMERPVVQHEQAQGQGRGKGDPERPPARGRQAVLGRLGGRLGHPGERIEKAALPGEGGQSQSGFYGQVANALTSVTAGAGGPG